MATIGKEQTTLVDGKGEVENIEARIETLQTQIDNAKTPYETEQLQNRLAKFVGGVAIIHVGGFTETEMNERKDRVDDSLQLHLFGDLTILFSEYTIYSCITPFSKPPRALK